jgi:hypothetical protein
MCARWGVLIPVPYGICRKLIGVEAPPLVLSTGGRFSLAISITAEAPVTQVRGHPLVR